MSLRLTSATIPTLDYLATVTHTRRTGVITELLDAWGQVLQVEAFADPQVGVVPAATPTKREGRVYRLAVVAVPVIQFIRAQYLTGARETIVAGTSGPSVCGHRHGAGHETVQR